MNADVPELVADLFRHESGRILGALVRLLGTKNLALAEDAVQEALARALRTWPFHGVPDRPAAWLHRVARNHALDETRKARRVLPTADQDALADAGPPAEPDPDRVADDALRLLFLCSHPALPLEARVAFTLKSACGFGVPEIARAFLVAEPTVAQRLVRVKRFVAEHSVRFEVPSGAELVPRLDAVLLVLYAMFNAGYTAHEGEALVRFDVLHEAIRLGEEITRSPALARPKVHALLALFCLQAARWPARSDDAGDLLTLEEQDRRLWDGAAIARGFWHLERAGHGDEITSWHLEAAIASCHARAATFAATDWSTILGLYDRLLARWPSSIVALNRAVALAHVAGPEAGLAACDEIAGVPELQSYALWHAVRAELRIRLGLRDAAAADLRGAMALPCSAPERAFLAKKLARLEAVP